MLINDINSTALNNITQATLNNFTKYPVHCSTLKR